MSMPDGTGRGVLDRGLLLLEHVSRPGPVSPTEVGEDLGVGRSSLKPLHADVEAARQRGYAVDNVDNGDGVGCFAAPVLDHVGRPVCANGVAGPAGRVLPKESATAVLVMQTALLLSRRLGHRP